MRERIPKKRSSTGEVFWVQGVVTTDYDRSCFLPDGVHTYAHFCKIVSYLLLYLPPQYNTSTPKLKHKFTCNLSIHIWFATFLMVTK